MAFLTLIGGLAVALVVALWAVVKVLKYRLSVETDSDRKAAESTINQVVQLTYTVLILMALAEFWPGLAAFLGDVFGLMTSLL